MNPIHPQIIHQLFSPCKGNPSHNISNYQITPPLTAEQKRIQE